MGDMVPYQDSNKMWGLREGVVEHDRFLFVAVLAKEVEKYYLAHNE